MFRKSLNNQINELSVVARQCIAAICFERYCEFHKLRNADIKAFIDHIWHIGRIENPDQFVEWEQGFQSLRASGWGEALPEDLLETIPPVIREEYGKLTEYVIETSAATWYAGNLEGTREYLLKVIGIVSKYGIVIPDFSLFRNSSPKFHGGWGNNLSPDELNIWRYES